MWKRPFSALRDTIRNVSAIDELRYIKFLFRKKLSILCIHYNFCICTLQIDSTCYLQRAINKSVYQKTFPIIVYICRNIIIR